MSVYRTIGPLVFLNFQPATLQLNGNQPGLGGPQMGSMVPPEMGTPTKVGGMGMPNMMVSWLNLRFVMIENLLIGMSTTIKTNQFKLDDLRFLA